METREILSKLKNGQISVEDAEQFFKRQPFEEMGYAKLDMHRRVRSGFAEVIYCSRKSDEHLLKIFGRLYEQDGEVFGTRASEHQYELIRAHYPEVEYDPLSRIIKITKPGKKLSGKIAVCTAGTADISVAEEAAQTAEYFGTRVERIYDVGVSGIHRLLSRLDAIQDANCIVAVAGMEGALASVLGGLVDKPVIAVPTSVGYGASLNGLSALLTMINSCANGIAVVNIDNGYGAGYLATQINRIALGAGRETETAVSQDLTVHGISSEREIQDERSYRNAMEFSGSHAAAEKDQNDETAVEPHRHMTEVPDHLISEKTLDGIRESAETSSSDQILRLESNMDDCTGEMLGHVMDLLLEAGARDVNYTPIFMKKNRPAYQLNVICTADKAAELEQIIFAETTTIGIRRQKMERTVLKRELMTIQTDLGLAQVKVCRSGSVERAYVEYESAAALARQHHIPLPDVYRVIEAAWSRLQ